MIRPEELRKGILVYGKKINKQDKTAVVTGFMNDTVWIKYKYQDQYLNDCENEVPASMKYEIQPIPLTEELLVKAGFKKHLDTIFIHWSKEGGMFEISTREPNGSYGLWVNGTIGCFQYLHQLQNLYFALTGTELTIKL